MRARDRDESTPVKAEVVNHVALDYATADVAVLVLFELACLGFLRIPSSTDGVHYSRIGQFHWLD